MKKWFLLTLLILLCSILLLNLPKSKNDTALQKNIDNVIQLGEYIANDHFSKKDKENLSTWLIKNFSTDSMASTTFYTSLNSQIIPKIKNSPTHSIYRAELYLKLISIFKNPKYQSPDNLLAIINRYNPPIQEASQLQLLYYRMLISNQQVFNQTLNHYQQTNNATIKDFKGNMQRQNITLSGGTILYELNDKIIAKDAKGVEYEVLKD